MKTPDVIVIGAGVAGLRAAVDLAQRGARVTVLEAKAILGGRASSFTDPQTGDRVDNGQHVVVGCYHETFRFLAMIGTAGHVRLQPSLDVEFVDLAGMRSRLRCPALPPPMNLLAGLLDWTALGWADRLAALHMARIPASSPFETVEQWLINNGQTSRLRMMLWEPLALAALNQSAREAAAPPFARVLAQMFGGDSRDASLGLPAVPLGDLYAGPARRFVEARGGEVRVASPATVRIHAGMVEAVDVRGSRLQTGAVICAVPWHAIPDLFTGDTAPVAALQRAAAATQASPIVSVNLWLDRQVLQTPFLGLPGRTMQWVFDKQQLFEGTSHLTMVSSGAEAVMSATNEELTQVALGELRGALPESRSARLLRATVVRERRATFSLAPGQPPRPPCLTNVGGLVLAGDWIDTGLPATIEGAAVSGRMAAELIS
jgi:squalene-associated FAD-dependent desaturase